MNSKSVHYDVEGHSLIEEVIVRITSTISGLFENIRAEQEVVKQRLKEKRQILGKYHQELIDGLPLEERLKLGGHRF